jgi:hypothetical protein
MQLTASLGADSDDSGADLAQSFGKTMNLYKQMALLEAEGKDQDELLKAAEGKAKTVLKDYEAALAANRASSDPGRARWEADILKSLGDVRLGLLFFELQPDTSEEKLTPEQVWNKVGENDAFYEQARAAYKAAGMPSEEGQMSEKMAGIFAYLKKELNEKPAAGGAGGRSHSGGRPQD